MRAPAGIATGRQSWIYKGLEEFRYYGIADGDVERLYPKSTAKLQELWGKEMA